MICDWEKCDDKSPHEWGEEGCERPTFRCRICGEYFDETRTARTREVPPHDTVEVCPVEECGSEDYTKMHDGFESGNEVVVLDGPEWVKGVFRGRFGPDVSVKVDGIPYGFSDSQIFTTTKSGWLKLCERLESQRAALKDAIDLADEEIKKLEEEEKCDSKN
jgi:hypothetical protein